MCAVWQLCSGTSVEQEPFRTPPAPIARVGTPGLVTCESATIRLMQGANARFIAGRRVMKPARTKKESYRLAFLIILLLSIAMFSKPTITEAG
jgi:hypothetical protein